jgi:hypothetical protein
MVILSTITVRVKKKKVFWSALVLILPRYTSCHLHLIVVTSVKDTHSGRGRQVLLS